MHQIKTIVFIFILLTTFSCIKLYDPFIESNDANKYVVSGQITDTEGWQSINISISSPIEDPSYIPAGGCQVELIDGQGNHFQLAEQSQGNYTVYVEQQYLYSGATFMVEIQTPEGDLIQSGYDTIMQVPPIDTVYYQLETLPTPVPGIYHTVVQFYIDLNAEEFEGRYFKWDLEETWELHAAHPAENYYDGDWHQVIPADSTNYYCWTTKQVQNIYTLSTKSLSQNSYKKYALNTVSGKTSRLEILYSLLIKQSSLSEAAYNYYEQLRANSTEQGGLYEKQPFAIKGNLQNLTHPDKEVLGYFHTASQTSKRYFFSHVEGLIFDYYDCLEAPLGRMGWKEFFPEDYPVYYYITSQGLLRILTPECVDCTKLGGKLNKPDFWP